MRPIDADALKELFSEVIGSIAKKPEMNGNLEHMIRASAMVIQMIDDAPTVQPDTTTHDSIPAETGKNDGDKTSGDCISRTQAIDALDKRFGNVPMEQTAEILMLRKDLRELPFVQPEMSCSEIPNNWIPCSERLPEEGEVVLTQAKFKDDVKMAVSSRIDYNYWTTWGTRDINIIAWKPLPEPYQEGGDK